MNWLDHKIPPPVVGLLVGVAMWAVAGIGPQLGLPSQLRNVLTGLVVAAAGTFDLLGLLAFRASRTTINPLKPALTSALVTGGVYRLTRNPMYVGIALLLAAWAVWLSSLLPLAGLPVFVAYITRFQIQPEERALKKLFGEEFVAYASRVRRWL